MRSHGRALAVVVLALLAPAAIATASESPGGSHRLFAASKSSGGPSCLGKPATISGTPGNDNLTGTLGPDVIAGLAGNDQINGGGGNDLICGGAGNDVISGGKGNDRLQGGAGSDWIMGNQGQDHLMGGAGNDLLNGGANVDQCEGGSGKNSLLGCEEGDGVPTPVANRPPQAGDVPASTDENTPKSIDVLAASSDPDGDPLTIASLDTLGTTGRVSIGGGGKSVLYDPSGHFDSLAPGETATDSFGYTVSDGHGNAASATVTMTINGVDDPPTAVNDTANATEDEAKQIDVRANDTDPDGGPKTIASVTQPAHGTVSIENGGLELSYQPEAGYCNDEEPRDSFTYTLNGGSSATVTVAVACVTKVSTSAELFPTFDPSVSDYVVHCDGSSLGVSGRTARGESVAVDGEAPQGGNFQDTVPLQENQEFDFTVEGEQQHEYHVRCLPSNFPIWNYQRFLPPRHEFYFVTPTLAIGSSAPPYAVIFDNHGVPVWWYADSPAAPSDAKVLPNGDLAWWGSPPGGDAYEIRNLEGTLLQSVRPVTGIIDPHEFQVEPNGNYLIITSHLQEHVDLTAYGGGPDDTVNNAVIEELKPNGELVWEWSTQGHIGLSETGRWWPKALLTTNRDIVHMNAVEPDGENAVLISLRHTDAVYKIDKTTGEVVWKLGGTWTPKSLTVLNDPQGAYPLGGQHDVRLQPDGTITIHDNDTNLPDPPRAVRYEINEANKTATLLEQVTDPEVPSSICCGSARRSSDGSWLMSWGGNSLVTEFNAAGQRTFQLGFGGTVFSYRAVSAPENVLSAATLRAGMDFMHPRP